MFVLMILIFLHIINFSFSFLQGYDFNIAVCITGQPSRFLPKFLFESNLDIKFDLFYNFQQLTELIYSTDSFKSYDPSPYANFTTSTELENNIKKVYESMINVEVVNVQFTIPKTRKEWEKYFNYPALDKIYQYT